MQDVGGRAGLGDMMKTGVVPFVLLGSAFAGLSSSAFGQAVTPYYPPPPAPGYVYTLPYGGYPAYAGAGSSVLTVAGDIYCVGGSDTQNVEITKIGLSSVATGATTVNVSVVVRSSANVGGSPNTVTIGGYDQNKPAATAVAKSYDAVGALGTSIATVRSANIAVGAKGGNNAGIGELLFRFEPSPLLLRGSSQFACINVGAIGAGATTSVFHEHIETTVGFP
jgi:hypothetical protein